MLFYQRRASTESGSLVVHRHHEELGVCFLSYVGVTPDDAIERCIAVPMHLDAPPDAGLRLSIQLCTIPHLAGAEIFSDFAGALLDVIPAEMQRARFRADSPKRPMHIGCSVL